MQIFGLRKPLENISKTRKSLILSKSTATKKMQESPAQ